jgi:branched-subunit amino acid aminotransferase/4-amino-4-deoxychorismate lyase
MTAVPTDDRGLLLGDGLFETLLVRDGEPVLWAQHLARLSAACAALGLPTPAPGELMDAARRAVADAGLVAGRAALRMTWTAGSGGRGLERPAVLAPRLIASASPAPPPAGSASLSTVAIRRNATSPASRLKTLAYLDNVLARREAAAQGGDEALMLNTDGHLACAAAANLFWIAGERLHTPRLACGVLDGIMRGQVLAAAGALNVDVIEAAEGPGALGGAQGAFLTSSLIGLRPVVRIDGRALPDHPLVAALQAALRAVT